MSIHRCCTEAYPFQSNIFNFLFFGHDEIRLRTLIIAYSAIDMPGLRAVHFPQASVFLSMRGKSFLHCGQLDIYDWTWSGQQLIIAVVHQTSHQRHQKTTLHGNCSGTQKSVSGPPFNFRSCAESVISSYSQDIGKFIW